MPPARVLLLEDDPPLREILVEFLAEERIAVTVCGSLRELLAAVVRHPGAVVVADGWEPRDHLVLSAAHRAEIADLAGRAAVILATGRAWATDTAQNDLGAAAILPKPYTLDDLLAAVRAGLAAPPAPRPPAVVDLTPSAGDPRPSSPVPVA